MLPGGIKRKIIRRLAQINIEKIAFGTDPQARLNYGDKWKNVNLDKAYQETATNSVGLPTRNHGRRHPSPYTTLSRYKPSAGTLHA